MQKLTGVWLVSALIAPVLGVAAMGALAGCGGGGSGTGTRLTSTAAATKEECPAGGWAVSRGYDDDGDSVLDDEEVDERTVECNPLREVTRLVTVAPGAICFGGGLSQQHGLDRNGNDVLDDEEVERNVYQCSTVVSFDVTLRTPAEAQALAQITEIQGFLRVESAGGDGVRALSLPQLRKVTGGISLGASNRLVSVSMPELAEIGGDFVANELQLSLQTLAFPKLARVGGDFIVMRNPLLSSLAGFSALARVGGDFVVEHNSELTTMRVPRDRVGGAMTVRNNDKLQALEAFVFEGVGDVLVADNAVLFEVALGVALFDRPPAGAGAVTVRNNPLLERVNLSAPQLGSVLLHDSPALSSTSIAAEKVMGDVEIRQNSGAVRMAQPSSGHSGPMLIGGELTLREGMELLFLTGGLRVEGAASFVETRLIGISDLEHVGGKLRLSANSLLSSVQPIGFLGGEVEISDNGNLSAVTFVRQPELFGSLVITGNRQLVNANDALAVLQRVRGSLVFLGNDELTSVVSPVGQIDGGLNLQSNDRLEVLRLDNITQLTGIRIQMSYALPSISLPALQTTGAILLQNNLSATQLLLPQLTTATKLEALGNSLLPTCRLRELCDRLGLSGSNCALTDNSSACP